MKTFISFITFMLIVAVGISSFILFQQSEYVLSALLTFAGFLALNGWVYYLSPEPQAALQ
jgi:hypothetical protein